MDSEEYAKLNIGEQVFVLVTPLTPCLMTPHYRPKPYFVLETRVLDVCGDGARRFDSNFLIRRNRVFRDVEVAKIGLAAVFGEETSGTIDLDKVVVVNAEEYAAGTREIDAKTDEIVGRQMEDLRML